MYAVPWNSLQKLLFEKISCELFCVIFLISYFEWHFSLMINALGLIAVLMWHCLLNDSSFIRQPYLWLAETSKKNGV